MKKLILFLTIALLFTACSIKRYCIPGDYSKERTKAVRADHKGFY